MTRRSNGGGSVAPANREDRRTEILRLAARTFADKGFISATVRDIADAAGILSGSLYHHFDSKGTMLEEILRSMLEGLVEQYRDAAGHEPCARSALHEMIRIGLHAVVDRGDEIKILHNDYGYLAQIPRFAFVDDYLDQIMKLWVEVLDRGVQNGEFRTDFDVRVVYRAIMGAVFTAVRWFQPGGALSIDDLTDEFMHIYIHGVEA